MIQGAREELSEYAGVEATTAGLEGHRRALAWRAKLNEEESKLRAQQRPNGSDLEGRITILVERINKGERVLEKAQHFEGAKERWETYVREKSSSETKINVPESLTEFFGPNGTMMGQARGRIGSFSEALNRRLAIFGYTCKFALEPFEIRVTSSNDEQIGLSLKHLSESEQFRFGVVFQIALATVTAVRFVVIDRADVLDRERRKLLTGLLLHSGIDQAIVRATGEESPSTAVPQGVKFFDLTKVRAWVKEGVIEPPLAIDIHHQGRHDAPETSLQAPRPTS